VRERILNFGALISLLGNKSCMLTVKDPASDINKSSPLEAYGRPVHGVISIQSIWRPQTATETTFGVFHHTAVCRDLPPLLVISGPFRLCAPQHLARVHSLQWRD